MGSAVNEETLLSSSGFEWPAHKPAKEYARGSAPGASKSGPQGHNLILEAQVYTCAPQRQPAGPALAGGGRGSPLGVRGLPWFALGEHGSPSGRSSRRKGVNHGFYGSALKPRGGELVEPGRAWCRDDPGQAMAFRLLPRLFTRLPTRPPWVVLREKLFGPERDQIMYHADTGEILTDRWTIGEVCKSKPKLGARAAVEKAVQAAFLQEGYFRHSATLHSRNLAGDCAKPIAISRSARSDTTLVSGVYIAGSGDPGPLEMVDFVRCRSCERCEAYKMRKWWSRMMREADGCLAIESPSKRGGRPVRNRIRLLTLTVRPSDRLLFTQRAFAKSEEKGEVWASLTRQEQYLRVEQEFAPSLEKFLQKLSRTVHRSCRMFRYVLVPEAHADGFPHWHLLLYELRTGVAQITNAAVEKSWPHGFVYSETVKDRDTGQKTAVTGLFAVRYVAKYIGKAGGRVRPSQNFGHFPWAAFDACCRATEAEGLASPIEALVASYQSVRDTLRKMAIEEAEADEFDGARQTFVKAGSGELQPVERDNVRSAAAEFRDGLKVRRPQTPLERSYFCGSVRAVVGLLRDDAALEDDEEDADGLPLDPLREWRREYYERAMAREFPLALAQRYARALAARRSRQVAARLAEAVALSARSRDGAELERSDEPQPFP